MFSSSVNRLISGLSNTVRYYIYRMKHFFKYNIRICQNGVDKTMLLAESGFNINDWTGPVELVFWIYGSFYLFCKNLKQQYNVGIFKWIFNDPFSSIEIYYFSISNGCLDSGNSVNQKINTLYSFQSSSSWTCTTGQMVGMKIIQVFCDTIWMKYAAAIKLQELDIFL